MTNENGVLRQTIFYPYSWALQYARGEALNIVPEGPTYTVSSPGRPTEAIGVVGPTLGDVPYLDAVATHDPETKAITLFVLNRDLKAARDLELVWRDAAPASVKTCLTLTGQDLKATNTFDQPNRVAPQKLEAPRLGSQMTVQLPARSYSVFEFGL